MCVNGRAANAAVMTVLRHITLCLAILTLVVTAQAFALARGAAPVAGQMVLCIGTGSVTVNIDADGQPVGAPHICPDAALTLLGQDVGVWAAERVGCICLSFAGAACFALKTPYLFKSKTTDLFT